MGRSKVRKRTTGDCSSRRRRSSRRESTESEADYSSEGSDYAIAVDFTHRRSAPSKPLMGRSKVRISIFSRLTTSFSLNFLFPLSSFLFRLPQSSDDGQPLFLTTTTKAPPRHCVFHQNTTLLRPTYSSEGFSMDSETEYSLEASNDAIRVDFTRRKSKQSASKRAKTSSQSSDELKEEKKSRSSSHSSRGRLKSRPISFQFNPPRKCVLRDCCLQFRTAHNGGFRIFLLQKLDSKNNLFCLHQKLDKWRSLFCLLFVI